MGDGAFLARPSSTLPVPPSAFPPKPTYSKGTKRQILTTRATGSQRGDIVLARKFVDVSRQGLVGEFLEGMGAQARHVDVDAKARGGRQLGPAVPHFDL